MERHAPRQLLLGLCFCAAACATAPVRDALPAGKEIGAAMEARPVVHLAVVDSTPAKYLNQTLLVEGRVKAVCQQAGCWMQIEDRGHVAWVRWETGCGGKYAFPKDSAGKRILVQGSFYPKKISAEEAEHLRQEAGKNFEVELESYELNASSVRILD